jgi:peptide/nickel transport system substrate-binding protein
VNPRIDALIKEGRSETDPSRRKAVYSEIQRILATDLPYINLWFLDNVIVHTKRVQNITLNPSGNCDFLKTAEIASH